MAKLLYLVSIFPRRSLYCDHLYFSFALFMEAEFPEVTFLIQALFV